jgi:hypothetical protein
MLVSIEVRVQQIKEHREESWLEELAEAPERRHPATHRHNCKPATHARIDGTEAGVFGIPRRLIASKPGCLQCLALWNPPTDERDGWRMEARVSGILLHSKARPQKI